jgi:hypothetical protein
MTPEALKKQKEEKAAVDKVYYLKMAEFHKSESKRFQKAADDCNPIEFVGPAAAGKFSGL